MLALQGLGALLAVFWIVGAVRRRMLERAWSPRTLAPVRDPDAVNRPLMALAVGFLERRARRPDRGAGASLRPGNGRGGAGGAHRGFHL